MKNTTRLGVVLGISIMFFLVEIAVGFRTQSLALIADAFHYLNDIVAYAIAFVAAYLQTSGQHSVRFTYAFHRAELVGAFFNGVFLVALALSIFLQSIERFVHVEEVQTPLLILIVGCIGLTLNIISALVVHDHHGHGSGGSVIEQTELKELNVLRARVHATHHHTIDPPAPASQQNLGLLGVLIHLLGDAVNNIGVIIAAVVIWKTSSASRFYADPAVSLAISIVIFASAIPLTQKTGRILLEATPLHLDLEKIEADLLALPTVLSIHDLHVWHLSQSVILASLHVCVPVGTSLEQWEITEQSLQHCFEAYGINHVTISPEMRGDTQAQTVTDVDCAGGCSASQKGFGCAKGELKKRNAGVV